MKTQHTFLTASVATLVERNDPGFRDRLMQRIDSGKSKRPSAVWSTGGFLVSTEQGNQVMKRFSDAKRFAAVCRRCTSLAWAIHESVVESVSGRCVLSLRARVGIPGGTIHVQ